VTASSSNRWQRLQELFYEALDLKPEARAEFLEKQCGEDVPLRTEIEELLEATEKPLELLKKPVMQAAHQMMAGKRREMIAPGTRLGHYQVISLLGAGGMGEVYLAEDTRLRRKVALKVLKPELTRDERDLRRFEHEAHAASALNHPSILTIYEFGQEGGLRFIASEFIDGITLRRRIAESRLPLGEAVDFSIQIASALAAAHASGIVHRDVKPENVIIRKDGIVKVLDFGIAKLGVSGESGALASASTSSVSRPGVVLGTAKYMSPEQARGIEVDARSDIFSLGSVIYEMVTGREAFKGATTSDVIAEILKAEPAPPMDFAPDLPYELEHIIGKALRKERDVRYQSVKDLLIDLQDFKTESEFQAKLKTVTPPERAHTSSGWRTPARAMLSPTAAPPAKLAAFRRAPFAWVLTGLMIAILGIAGYFYQRRWSAHPTPVSHTRSLAVLPFRNLKEDPSTDFLGFSLADEVITKLGGINSLVIRPSTSVDKYRNQVIDPQKVAAELNVDTLLTGSFIKDGDDLRITTQLIDVKPDRILWREAIDVKYDKLLTVQDRVSEQIIKGLELNLSPVEAASIKPEKPISNAAYEDYLRGIDLYSRNQFGAAMDALEKSTAIAPSYGPAWAHLGRAYTTHASLEFGGRGDYIKAQAAYAKAIALNPTLVEPRVYMANLLTDTGRVEEAVPLLRAVLKDNPNAPEAHWELGYAYRFAGMLNESVEECERARQNNPQVKINSSAFNSYLYLGEYDKFLQTLPAADNVYILFYRGFGEFYIHNFDLAAKDFDLAYERDPSQLPSDVGKALSDSIRHDNADGLKVLEETQNKVEERGVSDAEGIYKLAQAYAVLGDKASALHMLRHSIGGGFFCYPYFEHDPLLQNLRGEPEFQTLMKQALDRHEQFKKMFF
jgi:serine/threonine protein kinase/tetratricopeptide (TPR) repeat protein